MIPKIIHYCWLSGDEYPEKIQYCINSWKKNLPDYEIWLWDLKRFDIDKSPWSKEAFIAKKYAFAADYIRFYALYNYGGIYLDSDVEVIRSFNDLLNLPYFIGKERKSNLEPAIMGAEKGWTIMKDMIDYYDNHSFVKSDGSFDMTPCPDVMDERVRNKMEYHIINSIKEFIKDTSILNVFEADFFSPKYSNNPYVQTTDNTYSIHHFEASWYPADKIIYRWIYKFLGPRMATAMSRIYHFIVK